MSISIHKILMRRIQIRIHGRFGKKMEDSDARLLAHLRLIKSLKFLQWSGNLNFSHFKSAFGRTAFRLLLFLLQLLPLPLLLLLLQHSFAVAASGCVGMGKKSSHQQGPVVEHGSTQGLDGMTVSCLTCLTNLADCSQAAK